MMNKQIELCLIDIDGVLYDFVNHTLPYFNTNLKEQDITNYKMSDVLRIPSAKWWSIIDNVDGAFCDGLNYSWANSLIDICKKYSDQIAFCSNPGNNPKHWAEKRTWAERHFRDIPLILTQNKEILSRPRTVLIDDFEKNINAFNKGNGIGILFPQYWNKLCSFRKDLGSVDYIDCTLEDISKIGFNTWKSLKNNE